MEILDFYVDVIRTELLLALPVMAGLTIYALRIALRQREYRAPWLLFAACALAGADATWLAGASWYRDNVAPLPDWALAVNATAVAVNAHLPFIVIAYFAIRAIRD
jgi:hypothetical protein